MRFFSSGRYATVASTLALVVALSGASYAAVVVTGSQIKDNTVTSKDIKDKTIKTKDISADAKDALKGSDVKVASVATGFPSGQTFRDIKLAETRAAVEAGADEVDMVIDRGAFLSGDYAAVFEEIVEVKDAAGQAHLKVILETGELETYDNVRRASILAMAAGADFIKTSTGKVVPAATMPVTLVMLEAIRDFERATGRQVGMKPAGGIRTAKEAVQYLVILYETLGPRWMSPDWFRFGASSLLNDVLMQIEFQRTGRYQDPDDFTID